jgi:hypothetical protein
MQLPRNFIAGFIQTTGSFLWVHQNGKRIAVFQIKCHIDLLPVLQGVVKTLKLSECLHQYGHSGRKYCLLLIRRQATIVDQLIPFLDGRLIGKRRDEYMKWRNEVMGTIRANGSM